jgi:hypothetical protein
MVKIYTTIHGQCTDAMIQELKTDQGYEAIKEKSDAIGLLKMIKKICYNYQNEQFQVLAMIRAIKKVFATTQSNKETNIEYLERFKNRITVAMSCGAHFLFPGILDYIANEKYSTKYSEITDQAARTNIETLTQEVIEATLYLDNANTARYGTLMKELENDFLKNQDNFPRNLVSTQKLLLNYKGAGSKPTPSKGPAGSDGGVMFAQQGGAKPKPTADAGKSLSGITCHDCKEPGHFQGSMQCPLQNKIVRRHGEKQGNDKGTVNCP